MKCDVLELMLEASNKILVDFNIRLIYEISDVCFEMGKKDYEKKEYIEAQKHLVKAK